MSSTPAPLPRFKYVPAKVPSHIVTPLKRAITIQSADNLHYVTPLRQERKTLGLGPPIRPAFIEEPTITTPKQEEATEFLGVNELKDAIHRVQLNKEDEQKGKILQLIDKKIRPKNLKELREVVDDLLFPVVNNGLLKEAERKDLLFDYILLLCPPKQKEEEVVIEKTPERKEILVETMKNNIMESEEKENKPKPKPIVVTKVEGASAIAYTPVRLSRKKDRELLGTEYVTSPVRRSIRTFEAHTYEELEQKKGLIKVGSVSDVLKETGFAYAPNKNLK